MRTKQRKTADKIKGQAGPEESNRTSGSLIPFSLQQAGFIGATPPAGMQGKNHTADFPGATVLLTALERRLLAQTDSFQPRFAPESVRLISKSATVGLRKVEFRLRRACLWSIPYRWKVRYLDNLALACVSWSLRKGARLEVFDPQTGKMAALFHRRLDSWRLHFRWQDERLIGLSPTGRASVAALNMNRPLVPAIRREETIRGRHPPPFE
ncbi:MAG: hypothetical protein ABSG78_06875 [Verrucomicrobiota bacterium]|jgi:hypothetical protein